ncbi:VCBS repeat-containing protein [Streptomyces sp. NPDC051776]|uniref:FG-GAP repeat domain-containing protein n=1 Tax=Streptomyces sp. NPDC051776 TaxID=3155414 RepID=UPI0034370FC3
MYASAHLRATIPAALLCAAALLLVGCSAGGDGGPAPSARSSAERDRGPVNRDDINGDGHADAVINNWDKDPKSGAEWHNNRFIVFAAPGGTEPGAAVRLTGRYVEPNPSLTPFPFADDGSTQFTGDLDDDGHADVVVSNMVLRGEKLTPEQHVIWGGPDGPSGAAKLPADVHPATAAGDFDGDGALDLLTLAADSNGEADRKPQYATVLHGPLNRDRGAPRATSALDVGYDGWASIAGTVVGDFDGDGRDDLVAKAEYDEEDVRFEEGIPQDVLDATFYRGTARGLKAAGAVPGITGAPGITEKGTSPIAAGDFDGDGRDDILAQRGDEEPIAVYGSGKGPGRGRPASGGFGKLWATRVVGDSNGDGCDDIVARSRSKNHRNDQVTVLLGGKDGLSASDASRTIAIDRSAIGLPPRRSAYDDHFAWDMHLADLDTDGRAELLIGTVGTVGLHETRMDGGYWILRGTKDGPSTTDRRFIKIKDLDRG